MKDMVITFKLTVIYGEAVEALLPVKEGLYKRKLHWYSACFSWFSFCFWHILGGNDLTEVSWEFAVSATAMLPSAYLSLFAPLVIASVGQIASDVVSNSVSQKVEYVL